jgi:hypothetical protein
MIAQHRSLNEMADRIDADVLRSRFREGDDQCSKPKACTRPSEGGRFFGKTVLLGF